MAASGTTGFSAGAGAGVLVLAMAEQTSQKARFERLENGSQREQEGPMALSTLNCQWKLESLSSR